MDRGLSGGGSSWSGERVAVIRVRGPLLRAVDGVPAVRPIHPLRVAGISGVCGGRVAWIWVVARIRVGRMLRIRVSRVVVCGRMWAGLDRPLRLGGAGGGVWRVEDDRRRLHGGDLVVLESAFDTLTRGVCVL